MTEAGHEGQEDGHVRAEHGDAVGELLLKGVNDRTRRAYESDWTLFESFCQQRELESLPASHQTLLEYLADLARADGSGPPPGRRERGQRVTPVGGYSLATIQRALAAIAKVHEAAGHTAETRHPLVRQLMKGIRAEKGGVSKGKAPLSASQLRKMVRALDLGHPRGARDRALLLFGFAGAFRRSELVALDVEHLRSGDGGIVVTIHGAKTDREREGQTVAIPNGADVEMCPVRAVGEWRARAGVTEGALFRAVRGRQVGGRLSAEMVADVVKRTARKAGLDSSDLNLGGHSLRAGLITAAAEAGKPMDVIMTHSRHKSVQVALGYIRRATLFQDNAASGIGL